MDEPQRLFDDTEFGRPITGTVHATGQDQLERSDGPVPHERKVGVPNARRAIAPERPEVPRARTSRRVKIATTRQPTPGGIREHRPDVHQSPSSSVNGRLAAADAAPAPSEAAAEPAGLRPHDESGADVGPHLVTILRAAELLGVGRTTGYELVAAGELEVVHIGRSARTPIESIDAYVKRLREAAQRPSRGVRVRMRE